MHVYIHVYLYKHTLITLGRSPQSNSYKAEGRDSFGGFRDARSLFEETFGSSFGSFFDGFHGVGGTGKSPGKRSRSPEMSASPPRTSRPVESPLKCSLEELFVSMQKHTVT